MTKRGDLGSLWSNVFLDLIESLALEKELSFLVLQEAENEDFKELAFREAVVQNGHKCLLLGKSKFFVTL